MERGRVFYFCSMNSQLVFGLPPPFVFLQMLPNEKSLIFQNEGHSLTVAQLTQACTSSGDINHWLLLLRQMVSADNGRFLRSCVT